VEFSLSLLGCRCHTVPQATVQTLLLIPFIWSLVYLYAHILIITDCQHLATLWHISGGLREKSPCHFMVLWIDIPFLSGYFISNIRDVITFTAIFKLFRICCVTLFS